MFYNVVPVIAAELAATSFEISTGIVVLAPLSLPSIIKLVVKVV